MSDIEEVDFDDPVLMARITLSELKRFYDEATKHFDAQFARLEMCAKSTLPEDDDESEYLSVMMEELEGMSDLVQKFGVIGIYRTFEIFLRKAVGRQRMAGAVISGQTARYVDKLKDQLKEIGVELTQPPFQWQEITKLREIRNCIAHNEGWVDKESASILRSYGLPAEEGHCLKLPKGYFLEALELVDKTCELIIEKCGEARKQGG